ncbi:RNA-binding protein [Trichococcus shcherbakoviae]|uniref:RNA-binding protein n=1 Tax=Trichococcus shcherbakoviae subsp. psychrophilus TaxID=2585775 RepID=A0A5C5E8W3_9LACT|nr:RNA-binding protein [Trichococcus shcherbakoviae]TNV69384.1 RNA-binding protein [Trichococcus shcherbakoviae subsp. psychrophilus]
MQEVYQHFRKEEQPFIDSAQSWITQAEETYSPYLTDFLDPRQQYILEMMVGKKGEIHVQFYGGYEAAERKRGIICPEYFSPTQSDFEMELTEVVYPSKFASLTHGKILGTLIGTGMKRELFGDILSDGTRWQFLLASNIASYVHSQVTKIGKVSVRLEKRTYTDLITPIDDWTIVHDTVSSLRLDTVIAAIYNISRQRAKELVTSGKVKLNWAAFERPDFELGLLDIVSIRGYGRIQIKAIEGKSKKDKWRVEFGVLYK